MSVDIEELGNFDAILTEVGELQLMPFFLICLPNILSAGFITSYVFTANTLDYR